MCEQLTKVFRQSNQDFVRMLNGIRMGYVSPEADEALRAVEERPPPEKKPGEPDHIKLYSKVKRVAEENEKCLQKIKKPPMVFSAVDRVSDEKYTYVRFKVTWGRNGCDDA